MKNSGTLTDEKTWCTGGSSGIIINPFIEHKDDQIHEDRHQENNFRDEFAEDVDRLLEIPVQKTQQEMNVNHMQTRDQGSLNTLVVEEAEDNSKEHLSHSEGDRYLHLVGIEESDFVHG